MGKRVLLPILLAVCSVSITQLSSPTPAVAAASTSKFVPAGPLRIMDTREGLGVPIGLRAPGSSTDLLVAGANGVPADATAVVLNATITESVGPGFVQLFPTGDGTPGASSNLNVVSSHVT